MPRLLLISCFSFVTFFAFAQKRADSLQARLKTLGQDTERVKTMHLLVNEIRRKDPEGAIAMADESLALAKKLNYRKGRIGAYMAKGQTYALAGKYEDVIRTYSDGIAQEKKMPGPESDLCNMYVRLGFGYYNLGRHSEALPWMRQGANAAEQGKRWDDASEAYRSVGMAYTALGDHAQATESFHRAITFAEKAGNKHQLGYAYIGLGNSFQYQKNYDEALKFFHKALETLKTNRAYILGVAGCYISIGNIYYFREDWEKAVEYYTACLNIRRELKDEAGVAGASANIGSVRQKQGRSEEALTYFLESLAVFEKLGDQNGIAATYSNLGAVYGDLGNYAEAEKFYKRSLDISRRFNYREWLKDSYSGMAELSFRQERYRDAYLYKDSMLRQKDTIIGEQHSKQAKELEAKFQNKQKEEEIVHLQEVQAQQAQVQAKQEQVIFAVSIGLFLVLVLCVFLVRILRERRLANRRLADQNAVIASKNKDITDSMTYARRIQAAVLPDEKILSQSVKDMFILNNPRDIVSGDFYWFMRKGDVLYVAAADCTGHGVPGALVSVVGINALNQILEQSGTPGTAEVLNRLHRLVLQSLNKDVHLRETRDGMDIALLRIDLQTRKAEFSGAARPLYYCSAETNGVRQLPADRMSIAGEKDYDDQTPYTTHTFSLGSETVIYLTSDGYADQFGGDKGKKFLTRRLAETLAGIWNKPMTEQKSALEKTFESWKGGLEQVDDVLIVGIRV